MDSLRFLTMQSSTVASFGTRRETSPVDQVRHEINQAGQEGGSRCLSLKGFPLYSDLPNTLCQIIGEINDCLCCCMPSYPRTHHSPAP